MSQSQKCKVVTGRRPARFRSMPSRLAVAAWTLSLTLAVLQMGGCSSSSRTGEALTLLVNPPAQYRSYATDAGAREALRQRAIAYLLDAAEDDYALYRMQAIEALQHEPRTGEEVARRGLIDPNPAVRFAALMVTGLQGYESPVPLAHDLLNDEEAYVQAAAAFVLRKAGKEVDLTPLATMLGANEWQNRAHAALILGELGEASAVKMLREALDFDNPRYTTQELRIAELHVAEALVKLGDQTALTRIRSPLFERDAQSGEVLALSVLMVGRLGDERVKNELVKLLAMQGEFRNSAEVRLACMSALAALGDAANIDPTWVYEYLLPPFTGSADLRFAAIQAQAAFVLGELERVDQLPVLAMLMDDADRPVSVQIAAAASILRLTRREP